MFDKLKCIFPCKEGAPKKSKTKTILLVEDEPSQIRMIEKTLSKYRYKVVTVTNSEDAFKAVNETKFDLILLDVILPSSKINGDEICRNLKSNPATRQIPVIFLTVQDGPVDIIRHFDLGGELHLTKPINAHELVSHIESVIGK
ncbi:MAG: response regulator [Candidatus Omnitrophica bacterium]|nr:response regulator [Candidatus Omnitrophota bacterium]